MSDPPEFRHPCGALLEPVEVTVVGDLERRWLPGPLNEPCSCPRCLGCGRPADEDGKCATLGCWHYELLVLE